MANGYFFSLKERGGLPTTFCPLLWSKITIDPSGKLKACCSSKCFVNEDGENLRIERGEGLDQYWNHPSVCQARKAMMAGEWPKECYYCRYQEENGVMSKRKGQIYYWAEIMKVDPIALLAATDGEGRIDLPPVAVDARLSHVCNLTCVMCTPEFSTSWKSVFKKLMESPWPGPTRRPSYLKHTEIIEGGTPKWGDDPSVVEWFRDHARQLREIQFAGGEPLLFKNHDKILDTLIDSGDAGHITLDYNTNATQITNETLERWSHFENLDLQLSVDGVGEQFEYIRTPAKWQRIEEVVQLLLSWNRNPWRWRFAYTVQILSVAEIPRFLNWLEGLGEKWMETPLHTRIHWNVVGTPTGISVASLPAGVQQEVLALVDQYLGDLEKRNSRLANESSLKNLPGILRAAFKGGRGQGSSSLDETIHYLNLLDDIHDKRWRQTFPWLSERLPVRS
ncbi:MAG: twitch domain-containing radical SAM protein [Bdellovibrionaceae bacterium]|nr:twitch domain-containing radical SAM protein [Bdellovibrionales bacterium]MCB9083487.1 twitch domain-containing radical SAM protein [Pseudobdellovibrionaceae bacterium]